MKKKEKESFEIDKTKLAIFVVLLLIIGFICFKVLILNIEKVKTEINQTKKIYICDEIDNLNSSIIKHIGDNVYINGKRYKYLDLKIQCEIKNRSDLNKQAIKNISIYINNTLNK